MAFDAVILAGGAARRLGNEDKASIRIGSRFLLDIVVEAAAAAAMTVVVGDRRPSTRPVTWTREEPPGGGPAAGVAAGVGLVTEGHVVVLAADLPYLTPEHVGSLVDRARGDGAVAVDGDGREQFLLAAYRTSALRDRLRELPPSGASMRDLTAGLDLVKVPLGAATFDCDTWENVEEARRRMGGE